MEMKSSTFGMSFAAVSSLTRSLFASTSFFTISRFILSSGFGGNGEGLKE